MPTVAQMTAAVDHYIAHFNAGDVDALVGLLAVAAKLGYFPPAAPYAFWMMTVSFTMLVLGSLLKGL